MRFFRFDSGCILECRFFRTGRFFRGMERNYVEDILARDDVKTFLQNVRSIGQQKRAVTGAELAIPENVLPMLRAKIEGYSKLM